MAELFNDPKMKWIRLNDLAGGVNERDDPYALRDNQLSEVKNMVFRTGPVIESRLGQVPYIDKSHRVLSAGVRGAYRYRSSDGTKKIIANSGGSIEADSDDGAFDQIATVTPDGEGFVHFAQHQDTVLITTNNDNTKAYNADAGTPVLVPDLEPLEWDFNTYPPVLSTSGGFLPDAFYRYRVTFDMAHGGDFLGETGAAGNLEAIENTAVEYDYADVDAFGPVTDTNKVEFKRPPDAIMNTLNALGYITTIRFYRSPVQTVAAATKYPYTEDTELFLIGTADFATAYAAAADTVIFTDYGKVELGAQIPYALQFYAPRARYSVMLKGRHWLFNCSIKNNYDATYTDQIHDLWWSRVGARGITPFMFGPGNHEPIEANDGEGGMGLVAYKGKALLGWKPNKTVLITIGDDNIDEDIPDLSINIVDDQVGLAAPESLQVIDGIPVWFSHKGPVYFDGVRVRALGEGLIQKQLLDEIPCGRRRYITSLYDSVSNEYILFHSNVAYPTYNRAMAIFNFNTNTWSRGETIYGVGTALEVKDSDCDNKILWFFDDDTTAFDTYEEDYLVVQAETGYVEGNRALTNIPWKMWTKFLDANSPHKDKEWLIVIVETASVDNIILDYKVDAKIDTEADSTSVGLSAPAFRITDAKGAFGATWKNLGQLGVKGRRIAIGLSGINSGATTKIISIILGYKNIGVTSK